MAGDGWWRDPTDYQMDIMRVTVATLFLTIVVRYIESSITSNDTAACKVLIQNAERYNSMAAQDSNPRVRLRHSAMAVANLQAARQLFSDTVIENATGLDVHVTSQHMEAFLNKNETQDSRANTAVPKASLPSKSIRLPIWP